MTPLLRFKVVVLMVLTFILSAMEVLGISLILPILALLVEPQIIYEKQWLANIYELSGIETINDFIRLLLFAMAGIIIFKNIAAIFINRWQISFLQNAAADVSRYLFSTYLRMPFSSTVSRDTGFFSYAINSLGSIFFGTLIQQSLIIISELLTVTLLGIALLTANTMATFIAIGTLAIAGGIINWRTSKKMQLIGGVFRKTSVRSIQLIMETFLAFKEIRVSGRDNHFKKAYFSNIKDLTAAQIDHMRTVMMTRHLMEITVAILIVLVAGLIIKSGTIGTAVGQLSLFGVATLRIMPSMSRIISALQTLKTTEEPLNLLERELVEIAEWQLSETYDCPPLPKNGYCESIDIHLRNIDFKYDSDTDQVINQVSLDIAFGSILGIAGPSGAGKTTLADIILGVIEPNQGEVIFNGNNFFDNPSRWRHKTAYVPQNISFVHGSLRENVAFGIDAEDIDDIRVLECLEQAQLSQKLKDMANGLDSSLGEGGKFLSGGEKQRIGIARALYQNASILILDEASSALDVETEDKLSQVLLDLKGVRTVIIIAHRLTTLQNCDQVAFMEDGRLLKGNSFNGLYNSNDRFKNMVDLSRINPTDII